MRRSVAEGGFTVPAPAHCLLGLPAAVLDPVLVTAESFAADTRVDKVNLGIGMYYDESGKVPLLPSVRAAEQRLFEAAEPWPYPASEGDAQYRALVPRYLYGDGAPPGEAVIQTLGGTGALALGAELLHEALDRPVVAISAPSWPNHRAIFGHQGYDVRSYRYLRPHDGGLDFEGMLADLDTLPAQSVIVLHGCCHNPSGVDLAQSHWTQLAERLAARRLIPFLDMAYLGFGAGIDADAYPARLFRKMGLTTLTALSFSKSLSLYGERIGALAVSSEDPVIVSKVVAYGRVIARRSYSMPPSHGARLVKTVLAQPDLHALWQDELAGMRARIRDMRHRLVDSIASHGSSRDFTHIGRQRGLFSYSGLSAGEIECLRNEHGIHAVSDGRLCIAALNAENVTRVGDAIARAVARCDGRT